MLILAEFAADRPPLGKSRAAHRPNQENSMIASFTSVEMLEARLCLCATCSDTLNIAVHGQHIVGDYVTGIGHEALGWPPPGGAVGAAIAGQGAQIPGGPGPGFHFPNGV